MPTPNPGGETREEWMARCVPEVLEDGAAEDRDQAVAMCSSMWEEATKSGKSAKKKTLAYAVLNVKQVEVDKRIFTGTATTPTPDRVGDIIEPLGVKFKNPLPLLHHHRSDMPVGTVRLDKPSKDGITFEARLPKIEEPGPLKDRVDTAWGEIKAGLVRGVSVGFRELEASILESGGLRFIESEILELSLVTIPANAEATIQTIKSFDADALAASGDVREGMESDAVKSNGKAPGVSGPIRLKPETPKGKSKMSKSTLADHISAFEATRAAKAARMEEIQQKALEESRSKDEAEQEEFDTLRDEIKSIDKELVDLREMQALSVAKAAPVEGNSREKASASRGGEIRVSVKEQKLPPGVRFARAVKCMGVAGKMQIPAMDVAKQMYPNDHVVHALIQQKATVASGTTTVDAWAGALVSDEAGAAIAEFLEYLRPRTIIGRFGDGGVPALRRVPFRAAIASQTSGGSGYWVGEGAAKPLTKFDFSRTRLEPLKVANIAVLTDEVLRDSSPSAETIVRDQLVAALAARLDTDFIDPDKAAVANVSPASITNGVTGTHTSATQPGTADTVRADLKTAIGAYITANNPASSLVMIMSAHTALATSLLMNAFGQQEFSGISLGGGDLLKIPVITSEYVGYTQDSPTQGRLVILVNANDIALADDGGFNVDMSREASLEMSDAPAQNSTTPTAAQMVSMFQTNSVAFRAERTINWMRLRSEAVYVIDSVNWGA
jgi:HK97 family phage major capsid protein/HK97 family phage prohead protease